MYLCVLILLCTIRYSSSVKYSVSVVSLSFSLVENGILFRKRSVVEFPAPPPPRVPILGVLPAPRSQLNLCLRMESAADVPPPCDQDTRTTVDADSQDGVDRTAESSELSGLASVHTESTDDVELDDNMVCLEDVEKEEENFSYVLLDNPDSSQQKIPNRDSGIDSPSCTAEEEIFSNGDAIDEEDHYDSVTETESVSCCVTIGNKRDSTQDEDSDLDEGSSGEVPPLPDPQAGFLTEAPSENQKVSTLQQHQQQL